MAKVAVSFTHIIKSSEPAFNVLVSRFLLGESFPLLVYLSLFPIIGGCALAAATELNFNMTGFMGAMVSNLAFVFRNIFSMKGMKGKSVSWMNYYACLSMLSLLILIPFAIAVEGPKMWAAGLNTALAQIGPNFVWWVVAGFIHVTRSDISLNIQRWEHNEADIRHSLLHHNILHACSTRQRTWSSHCNTRNLPLLTG